MQVAISRGGVIENIIEAESVASAEAIFPDAYVFEAIGVGIGWTDANSEWVAPVPPAQPSGLPTLTRKQLRNGLLSIGVTSADVEAQIGTIADPIEREAALIDWQDTQAYERDNPLVNQIGASMSLAEEQIDALWMWSAGS